MIRRTLALAAVLGIGLVPAVAQADGPAQHEGKIGHQGKVPVAEGFGGAVSTVDHDATKAGIKVLREGGNAVDAAVAAAATLGVTEPFSAGMGGGGFFVYYDAESEQVHTIDGRETAPQTADEDLFVDPETGEVLEFEEARVSGLSVGVPGTPATWQAALDEWGTRDFAEVLQPATRVARKGFEVDQTFVDHIEENGDIFDDFISSRELYLPDAAPPEVGSVFRNQDLAETYQILAEKGPSALYDGRLGAELAQVVQAPPVADDADRTVRSGDMSPDDLATYELKFPDPTHVDYHGLDVFSMGPPSSGGSTVGEALNILDVDPDEPTPTQFMHKYVEASSLAYADRNRYLGDPAFVDVPLDELLSEGFAAERRCEIDSDAVLPKPVDPGKPDGDYGDCGSTAPAGTAEQQGGLSTTHVTASDRWGNVVSYTLTIESTGGSGIVVPGRGYLLNNELTDFNFEPTQGSAPDPNLPGPGKRPRSSMSPTIVLDDGEPVLALGSPGGSTIITTVLQTLVNRLDLGMSLPDAVAAPRLSPRNDVAQAEPAFLESEVGQALIGKGHEIASVDEIGAATAIEFGSLGWTQAVAEPSRRGGGSAMVVSPLR